MTACGERPDAAVGQAPEPAAPETRVFTTADGNRMPYDVTGEGDVTVLLVHCWMCDRRFWDAQIPVLAERYRTLAVDLPGHGAATDERADWSVAAYGADVAAFIEDLDLSKVVLVGHSMGGPVALRAAALAGGRVLGIVAVDTLHDAEFVFPEEQMNVFIAAFEADYPATCRSFVEQMFPEANSEAARSRVQAASCGAGRAEIGIALMKDFGTIDMPAWFREAGVPIRAINAAQPNPTQTATNRKYADFDVVLMEGVGHYPHMSRPDEFNPLLLDAIAGLTQQTP
jgi:pimeloyl-ACP methyl ester carboxylesterase